MELYPINQFPDKFIYEFSKNLYVQFAVGIDRMEGKTFEKFFCKIFGVEWAGSNDGLIDVRIDDTGFSMKSLSFTFPVAKKDGDNKSIRTIIGRCAPDYHGKHIDKNTPPNDAAAIVTAIWNERLAKANQVVKDFRTLTILKAPDLLQWCLFEFVPQHYHPNDFVWEWQTRKCKGKDTTNLQGVNDNCRLTWQLHGAQFSLSQPVPNVYTRFNLKKTTVIDDILKQMGYKDDWVSIDRIGDAENNIPKQKMKQEVLVEDVSNGEL